MAGFFYLYYLYDKNSSNYLVKSNCCYWVYMVLDYYLIFSQ